MSETTVAQPTTKKLLKDLDRKIKEAIVLQIQLNQTNHIDNMTEEGYKEIVLTLNPLDEARIHLQNCFRYEGIK